MRVIKKPQLMYLVDMITHHLEDGCDDRPRWIQALKVSYKVLITMDNMGLWEETDMFTTATLDSIFEQLRNDFSRYSVYMPIAARYYK